jgi:hypothetical protein
METFPTLRWIVGKQNSAQFAPIKQQNVVNSARETLQFAVIRFRNQGQDSFWSGKSAMFRDILNFGCSGRE